MTKVDVNDLMSIVKLLDENFLSDDLLEKIGRLNIERTEDQRILVREAIIPELLGMNEVSKNYLKGVLDNCLGQKLDYRTVFDRISSPFEFSEIDLDDFIAVVAEEVGKLE